MYGNAQLLEILGWLIINLYFLIPEISISLQIPKIHNPTHFLRFLMDLLLFLLFGLHFFGFLIGSLLLYYSRDYGYFIFSFIVLWSVVVYSPMIIAIIASKNRLFYGIFFSGDFLFLFLFILFGIFYQTEIWFITATLYAIVIILKFINGIYFPKIDTPRNYIVNFLPGIIVLMVSILFVFDLGILNSATLYTFYSALIGGFFALLGIVAMFGVFILDRIENDKVYLSNLFKGLIIIYIISILTLTIGLVTLPKDSKNEPYLDISHNSLIPDIPLKERQLSSNHQIFGKIVFTASLGFLLSSLAYLYKIVSELLNQSKSKIKT